MKGSGEKDCAAKCCSLCPPLFFESYAPGCTCKWNGKLNAHLVVYNAKEPCVQVQEHCTMHVVYANAGCSPKGEKTESQVWKQRKSVPILFLPIVSFYTQTIRKHKNISHRWLIERCLTNEIWQSEQCKPGRPCHHILQTCCDLQTIHSSGKHQISKGYILDLGIAKTCRLHEGNLLGEALVPGRNARHVTMWF